MWRACGLVILGLAAPALAAISSQVHISLTLSASEMLVTWSTPDIDVSRVRYSEARLFPSAALEVDGVVEKFVDNGTEHHTQYMHRAVIENLKPRTRYVYQVWNDTVWSELFHFTSAGGSEWLPRFTVYGDFGVINARSLENLEQEARAGVSDIVVHVGDFAYNMFEENGTRGDVWFNMIQNIAANQPYMVCPGNHEGLYDFLNYINRFSMPNRDTQNNLYHSWNAGLTHWIAYSTEVYFLYNATEGHGGVHRNFGPYPEVAKAQLAFIEDDLKKATANRANQPWIIAYGHRPMYCSNIDDADCYMMRDQWRVDLEELFYRYGVDMVIEAHQHSYERLWPVYNLTILNGTTDPNNPYANPRAPVHIVSGSAGCQENLDPFGPTFLQPWSALRIAQYGYAHLTVHNRTHLHWEQLKYDDYEVLDEIWVTKDQDFPVFMPSPPSKSPEVHDKINSNSKAVTNDAQSAPNQSNDHNDGTSFVLTVLGVCCACVVVGFLLYWGKAVASNFHRSADGRGMYHKL